MLIDHLRYRKTWRRLPMGSCATYPACSTASSPWTADSASRTTSARAGAYCPRHLRPPRLDNGAHGRHDDTDLSRGTQDTVFLSNSGDTRTEYWATLVPYAAIWAVSGAKEIISRHSSWFCGVTPLGGSGYYDFSEVTDLASTIAWDGLLELSLRL
jgi:hypothetical protein